MPTMHRISCFRDDIIFVVYLYQRWIYRVDKTRGLYATEERDKKKVEPEDGKEGTKEEQKEIENKEVEGEGQDKKEENKEEAEVKEQAPDPN